MRKDYRKDLTPLSIFEDSFSIDNIGWCSKDNIYRLYYLQEGTIFVPDHGSLRYIPLARQTNLKLILVENPRKAFAEYIKDLTQQNKTYIHPTAKIGKNTIIHEGTYIDKNVVIGDNCTIGAVGFGYQDGELINHIGRVYISEGVEIGNNTCIDRAVVGDTFIDKNVKIDNLVHIAHGCKIGQGTMIIAGAVLCGSVEVGSNAWIAPNVSIRQKIKIGDNSIVGLGSVVVKDVPNNTTVKGNPAR